MRQEYACKGSVDAQKVRRLTDEPLQALAGALPWGDVGHASVGILKRADLDPVVVVQVLVMRHEHLRTMDELGNFLHVHVLSLSGGGACMEREIGTGHVAQPVLASWSLEDEQTARMLRQGATCMDTSFCLRLGWWRE